MNQFEMFAEKSEPRYVKKQRAANEKRSLTLKRREEAQLKRLAKLEREREERTYPKKIVELLTFLDEATAADSALIIQTIKGEWLRAFSKDIRYRVLSRLSKNIVRVREKEGLHPFDDPLPVNMGGSNKSLFFKAKSILLPEEW